MKLIIYVLCHLMLCVSIIFAAIIISHTPVQKFYFYIDEQDSHAQKVVGTKWFQPKRLNKMAGFMSKSTEHIALAKQLVDQAAANRALSTEQIFNDCTQGKDPEVIKRAMEWLADLTTALTDVWDGQRDE